MNKVKNKDFNKYMLFDMLWAILHGGVMAHHNGMGQYLDAIGRIPLLTAEDEITLSRAFREWVEAPNPSPQTKFKGRRAKEQLITSNLRLVVHLAKKYMHRGMDLEDLIQEGSLGLHRAVEKYDPSKGYRFSTYAYWWIRQALTRAIAEKSRLIQLPSHAWDKLSKIKSARREFLKANGRSPSVSEIADITELSETVVAKLLEQFNRTDCVSLDLMIGKEENTSLLELIPSDKPETFEVIAQANLNDVLNNLLQMLPEKEATVIRLRFGLHGEPRQTLQAVSDTIGISREQVRQIQLRVLRKLKAMRDVQELMGVA